MGFAGILAVHAVRGQKVAAWSRFFELSPKAEAAPGAAFDL
jgi:hypothetical protein